MTNRLYAQLVAVEINPTTESNANYFRLEKASDKNLKITVVFPSGRHSEFNISTKEAWKFTFLKEGIPYEYLSGDLRGATKRYDHLSAGCSYIEFYLRFPEHNSVFKVCVRTGEFRDALSKLKNTNPFEIKK